MEMSDDKKKNKGLIERDRIYNFLLGINKDLDEVRGRVLGTKPLPKLREVLSEVRREESRRKVMLGNSVTVPIVESSALAARGNQSRPPQRKNRPWCDHCKKPGHTQENCWVIHGKPPNARPFRNRETRGSTTH